jgi:hypothetical protein
MKHRKKNILRGMAKHLGLKIVFVDYLKDDVQGKLLPRERRILLNARKPRIEHFYTVLHEIGHFLLHFKNPHRKYLPRFLERNWKIEWLIDLCSKTKRVLRLIFAKESGQEFEADLMAMCMFIPLAKTFGCRDELIQFLERHPEKFPVFLLATYGVMYSGVKTRLQNFFKLLLLPFRFAKN